jgi:deoxyribodipyrimidine photo-lyase
MPAPYRRSAFVFRRDLRLADNAGLRRAVEMSGEVLPCFVLDPRQTDSGENEYFSAHAFQFLLESLEDLDAQLAAAGGRLFRFWGEPAATVARLIEEAGVEAVFVNRDYTPFSRARDGAIQEVCAARSVPFHRSHDALLTYPGQVLTGSGTPYRVFTPFWRAAREVEVPAPSGEPPARWATAAVPLAILSPDETRELLARENPELWLHGGRARGLALLDRIGDLAGYQETRDLPADNAGTSTLSPHHKLGTVSIRESFHRIRDALGLQGAGHELLRQLYWRDFFTQLAWFEPRVFGHAFRPEYDAVAWEDDPALFEAWCAGRTGFPLVDAGMRQLAATGWMPNRVRMVVASVLVKDLHLDWRRGERWFARHLVDYDPAVNNGNWQWAASTGADAQPYFRIFNPWRQQERFDPEAAYVRRWVPELAELEAKAIHGLDRRRPAGLDYPEPVVDHKGRAARAKELFEQARSR